MYYFGKDFLSEEEVNKIVSSGDNLNLSKAKVISNTKKIVLNKSYRDVSKGVLKFKDGLSWLETKLQKKANQITSFLDSQYDISLDISGGIENKNVQYLSYSDGGHYNWHLDSYLRAAPNRTLTIIVQLVDENEYEGGGVLLDMEGQTSTAPRSKGCCIAFPSKTMKHKIEKVISGTRKSIVLWFEKSQ